MTKIVHFGEFLKRWSLLSNSVTRQVSFSRTKICGKCQNWKIQMRHFGWFSNNVAAAIVNEWFFSRLTLSNPSHCRWQPSQTAQVTSGCHPPCGSSARTIVLPWSKRLGSFTNWGRLRATPRSLTPVTKRRKAAFARQARWRRMPRPQPRWGFPPSMPRASTWSKCAA